jgi:DNA-binding CsgD family transcriptional regulator/PAS domain-containing protein
MFPVEKERICLSPGVIWMEEFSFQETRNRSICSGESGILHQGMRLRESFLEKCSADSYVIYDIDGVPQEVSSNFRKTFGWSLDELKDQGNPYVRDFEKERSLFSILSARDGDPKWLVTRRFTKAAELLDIAVFVSRILDSEGQCVAFLVINRNLTRLSDWKIIRNCPGEDLIAEWNFQQEFLPPHHVRAENRIPLDKYSVGLAIVDLMGTCIRMNREFAHLLNLTGNDTLDSELMRIVFGNIRLWEKISTPNRVEDCEITHRKPDDTSVPLRMRTSIIRRDGAPNSIIALAVSDASPCENTVSCIQRDTGLPDSGTTSITQPKNQMHNAEVSRKNEGQSRQHSMKAHDAVKKVLQLHQDYKNDVQERIQQNLRLAVLPIIEELKKFETSESHKHLIDILDFNLRHIMSSFGAKVLSFESKLTKREMQICHMIRAGKNSREIAAGLNLTYETVIVHRKNIRKKLGLKHEKSSLMGYLRKWA